MLISVLLLGLEFAYYKYLEKKVSKVAEVANVKEAD